MKRDSSWPRKYVPFLLRLLCYYCVAQKQVQHNSSQCQYMALMFSSVGDPERWSAFHLRKIRYSGLDKPSFRALYSPPPHGPAGSFCAGDCSDAWRSCEAAHQDSLKDLWLFLFLSDSTCRVRPGWEWGCDWGAYGWIEVGTVMTRSLSSFPLKQDEGHLHTNVATFGNASVFDPPLTPSWHCKWTFSETMFHKCWCHDCEVIYCKAAGAGGLHSRGEFRPFLLFFFSGILMWMAIF